MDRPHMMRAWLATYMYITGMVAVNRLELFRSLWCVRRVRSLVELGRDTSRPFANRYNSNQEEPFRGTM